MFLSFNHPNVFIVPLLKHVKYADLHKGASCVAYWCLVLLSLVSACLGPGSCRLQFRLVISSLAEWQILVVKSISEESRNVGPALILRPQAQVR